MNAREIREKSNEEILDEIEDLKEALFKLRLQKSSGQLENENVIKQTRHDIARCNTVLRERQLANEQVAEKGSSDA
ncbi:MAG: 50S ribosomal protein L29 [Anaerolineaceae bacterium]|nr:50S ribosomal protein L29 [Anaerolineaceae bacterium]